MLQRVIELLKPDVSTDAKLTGVSLLVGKTLEKYDSRLKTLEIKTLIPIERGEQGRAGRDGAKGKDGENGRDGLNGKDGSDGKDGKPGKNGTKGEKGVSVVDAEIAVDDHLVLKLSDGKIIDAGAVRATAVTVANLEFLFAVSCEAATQIETDLANTHLELNMVRGDYVVVTNDSTNGSSDVVIRWGEEI